MAFPPLLVTHTLTHTCTQSTLEQQAASDSTFCTKWRRRQRTRCGLHRDPPESWGAGGGGEARPPEPQEDRAFVWDGLRTSWALAGTTENTNSLLDRAFRDSCYLGTTETCPNTHWGVIRLQREMRVQQHESAALPHDPPPRHAVSSDNCRWAPRKECPGAPPARSGAPGQSPPASSGVWSTFTRPPTGHSRPPGPAQCFLSAQLRTNPQEGGRGPGGLGAGGRASYLGQQPRAPPAAARPAAPAAAGAPRGGAAGAFLLPRRRRRRRLPGRTQNIHGLCPGSRPPRPGLSPRRIPGASAKFFVPLTCSLAFFRPPRDPVSAVPPYPSGFRVVPAGQSILGCPCRTGGRRVSPAPTQKSVPCARGLSSGAPSVAAAAAPPAPRAPSLALSLP